ncbi:hypothetical protein D3C80_1719540 [compost metagenome]
MGALEFEVIHQTKHVQGHFSPIIFAAVQALAVAVAAIIESNNAKICRQRL